MCSSRILCRLRLIRKKSKQPFKILLQDAQYALRTVQNEALKHLATVFGEKVREVIHLVDMWSNHQTQDRLVDLILGVYRLSRLDGLRDLLDAISNKDMDPASRRSLLKIVNKISRYRETARVFLSMAKRYPVVRRIGITLVEMPKEMFHQDNVRAQAPNFISALMRVSPSHGRRNLAYICQLLKVPEVEMSRQFADQAQETLDEAKIHAEIQILIHCERFPSKERPRVICSSKDACFLCNAFILMHGKMHIPRCHGRLYTAWRLPHCSQWDDLERRFNKTLETRIRKSLATLVSRRKKTVYPYPDESTLSTLLLSQSTIRSLGAPDSIAIADDTAPEGAGGEVANVKSAALQTIGPAAEVEHDNAAQAEHDSTPAAADAEGDNTAAAQLQTMTITSHDASVSTSLQPALLPIRTAGVGDELDQGHLTRASVEAGCTSPLYKAGSLEIHIDFSTVEPSTDPKVGPRILTFDMSWLTVEEAENVLKRGSATVFNAELLRDETLHDLDDDKCLYISARHSVVRLSLHPEIRAAA